MPLDMTPEGIRRRQAQILQNQAAQQQAQNAQNAAPGTPAAPTAPTPTSASGQSSLQDQLNAALSTGDAGRIAQLQQQITAGGGTPQTTAQQNTATGTATTLPTNPNGFAQTPVIGPSKDQMTSGDQIQAAMLARYHAAQDPLFANQQSALERKLANQGLVPGSEAYDAAMRNFSDARNRSDSDATQAAIQGGVAEQQRLFGNQLSYDQLQQQQHATDAQMAAARLSAAGRGAANSNASILQQRQLDLQAQQQGWSQDFQGQQFNATQGQSDFDRQMQLRNQFFNEMNGFQNNNIPQLGMPQIGNSNTAGSAIGNYNNANQASASAQQQQANQQAQAQQAQYAQYAQIAGYIAQMYCSRHLKENITNVPRETLVKAIQDLDVKQWNYIGNDQVRLGPMLDETPEVFKGDQTVIVTNILFALIVSVQKLLEDRDG